MNTNRPNFFRVFAVVACMSLLFAISLVHAQTLPTQAGMASLSAPIVNTYSAATSSGVYVVVPQGFNGQVTTTYDGHSFQTTYSTSTDATSTLLLSTQLQAEEQAMNNFFEAQQALFQQLWSNFDAVTH